MTIFTYDIYFQNVVDKLLSICRSDELSGDNTLRIVINLVEIFIPRKETRFELKTRNEQNGAILEF